MSPNRVGGGIKCLPGQTERAHTKQGWFSFHFWDKIQQIKLSCNFGKKGGEIYIGHYYHVLNKSEKLIVVWLLKLDLNRPEAEDVQNFFHPINKNQKKGRKSVKENTVFWKCVSKLLDLMK